MKTEDGKTPVLITLILLPFSFLATLTAVYVAIYGTELPFEVRLKSEVAEGKVLSFDELSQYRAVLLDSVRLLKDEIDTLISDEREHMAAVNSWLDSVGTIQAEKNSLEGEVAVLQTTLTSLKNLIKQDRTERMKQLVKILQTITEEDVDAMYVAGLDDATLMDVLAIARAPQAAVILQQVEPSRAAKLMTKYVNPNLQ
jgi:flagellar motility protein MotE (MotC chaperone)